MKISRIEAYQIFDSRGVPTIEVVATLVDGTTGVGMVPSGASTGQYEAVEMRDGDQARFRGRSVFNALRHIREDLTPLVVGRNAFDQMGLDKAMVDLDGTENKFRLGANAILGVSMAVCRAAANARRIPLYKYLGQGKGTLLPLPEVQIFGGGAHADWRIDVQDFLLIAVGAKSYEQSLEITHDVYHAAGDIMRKRGRRLGLADEGGYWPQFDSHAEVFETLVEAIEAAGYAPGKEAAISLDIAASDLYSRNEYHLKLEDKTYSTAGWAELMQEWCEKYPVISIEDPMADTDWEGWNLMRESLGGKVQLIGDDLFTTNIRRIEQGVARKAANAVLIKLNQIGTVTETLAAIAVTQNAGWLPVISARSGETEDAFISHLAVATNAGQLKVGSFARSERMVKWNEVLRIQHSLGDKARFVGAGIYDTIRKAK